MFRVSPTTLNLLQECPRCFWLEVRAGHQRPRSPAPSFIMQMDSVLKQYFDTYRATDTLPPLVADQVTGTLPTDMPTTLAGAEAGVQIVGRPDEYLQLSDGAIAPFDHKTKSKPPQYLHWAHQLQMDVYSYLLRLNGYQTADTAYLAYYYPQKGQLHEGLPLQCTVWPVTPDHLRVQRVIRKARRVVEQDTPPTAGQCAYCHWYDLSITAV